MPLDKNTLYDSSNTYHINIFVQVTDNRAVEGREVLIAVGGLERAGKWGHLRSFVPPIPHKRHKYISFPYEDLDVV